MRTLSLLRAFLHLLLRCALAVVSYDPRSARTRRFVRSFNTGRLLGHEVHSEALHPRHSLGRRYARAYAAVHQGHFLDRHLECFQYALCHVHLAVIKKGITQLLLRNGRHDKGRLEAMQHATVLLAAAVRRDGRCVFLQLLLPRVLPRALVATERRTLNYAMCSMGARCQTNCSRNRVN